MLKGKLKYLLLGLGVLVLSLGIMRYTPLAYGGNSNMGILTESRPRGHHRMMWDYDSNYNHRMMWDLDEEEWEEFRQDRRNFRGPRGCMGYFYDSYESQGEINK